MYHAHATIDSSRTTAPADMSAVAARLQQSELFREYQQAFQATTGLPLTLRAAGSFQVPNHGSRQINPFCALMAANNKTCAACLQLQQRIEESAHAEPQTLECFAGLSDSAVPIKAGDKVFAYLQTGQVLLRKPTPASFRQVVRRIADLGLSIDISRLKAAYFQTRVLARNQYQAVVRREISMLQESAAEPPVVMNARRYIAEHQGEAITLRQVAQAVHMSPFYFCKVFKSATGLTLTQYLARARVEAVKNLLLNPHTRVSEAAYEAGFQSLSQFNRVFLRITGESPSAYRERLHGLDHASGHLPRAA